MNRILALVPFSETSKAIYEDGYSYDLIDGEWRRVPWHLVIADKFINLGIFLPKWCEFGVYNHGNGEVSVTRYFGWGRKYHEDGEYYSFKLWRLPWAKDCFKFATLINGEWVEYETDVSFEVHKEYESKADRKKYSFKAYGKKIYATCWAKRYVYSVYWFPKWLKRLYNSPSDILRIEFSEEIGEGRGSWKGGTVGMFGDYVGSIRESWYKFKQERLPEILKDA